jgi:hypothetical protein
VKRVSIAQLAALPALALAAAGLLAGLRVVAQSTGASSPGYSFPIRDKNGIVRTWFKGASFKPLSLTQPTVLSIEQFRVETASANGTPEMVATAPQCTLDTVNKVATSSGPLNFAQADGQFRLNGVGFRWEQESGRLAISNKFQLIFRAGSLGSASPAAPTSAKP